MSRRPHVLYVRVHGLYVRELAGISLHGDTAATVVFEDGAVLDASDDAQLRGVVPGMPVGQARALLSGARFVACDREFYRGAQRRWLDALLPFSDALEPLSMHEAALDVSGHPRPGEIARRALASLAEVAPRVSSGIGPAVWIARLAADHSGDALADPAAFLAPLPVSALPIAPKLRDRLDALGCATVGAIAALPWNTLRRQFGPDASRIHSAAHGFHREPRGPIYPEDSLSGSVALDGGSESLEEIYRAALDLAALLGARLESLDRETPELLLHVGFDHGERTLERPFSRPIRDAQTLSAALSVLIAGGFHAPVHSLRVSLPRLRCIHAVQGDLYAERGAGSGIASLPRVR